MVSEILDTNAFERLVAGGQPIKHMREGVKVWRLPDDRIVKLFRPRGRFSRTRLHPANERFTANAQALTDLGFATVVVQRLFVYPPMGCSGVVYQALPGETLESHLRDADSEVLILRLGELMAKLHTSGVMFRALHLGNLLVASEGGLALIDVEETKLSRRPLGPWRRLRNFRHLLRREVDRRLLGKERFEQLVDGYLQNAVLSNAQQRTLRQRLYKLAESRHWPERAERS